MVRKLVLLMGIVIFMASPISAQMNKVEVTPFFGYTFSEGFKVDPVIIGGTTYDKINPVSGMSYGVLFGVFVTEQVEVGFLWSQQDSALEAKGLQKNEFADLKVNNYHGIVIYNWGTEDDMVRPFFLAGLGATNYSPGEVEGTAIAGNTKFSTTWGGGVRAYPGEHVGIQIMGRWTPTYIKSDPAGYWCNPWWPGGCWQLVDPDYSNQLELSAGVTFRF